MERLNQGVKTVDSHNKSSPLQFSAATTILPSTERESHKAPLRPTQKKSSYYCGTINVECSAKWIAVIGIAICVLTLFQLIWLHLWFAVVPTGISIATFICILIAQRKREPLFYLLYLIYQGIVVIVIPIYYMACVILPHTATFTGVSWPTIEHFPNTGFSHTTTNVITAVGLLASEIMGICFEFVVWRAYKHMKKSNSTKSDPKQLAYLEGH